MSRARDTLARAHGALRRARRRIVGAPMVVLLGATMVIVSALAFQAWRAREEQRATVGRALREYASFAAWEFASSAREEMWLAMTELLRPVERLGPADTGRLLPSPAVLAASHARVADCRCASDIPAAYYFRLDLATGRLTTTAAASAPSSAEEQWLGDTVAQHARDLFARDWRVATIVGSPGGVGRTVAYAVVRDSGGHPVTAYGVVSESNAFMAAFAAEVAPESLLPPTLARQAGMDTLVSIVVRDGRGNVVYRSPWQYVGYAASYPLSKFVSGFTVEATLRGDVARRIVGDGSGGRGRLAVLLALLALTVGLLAVALRQLRREAALARLRADFVSSVSHELRTPLTQIRMFAELLRLGWTRSAEERDRSLAVIDQEAHRLGLLVERVLAFDRTERLLALDRTERATPSLTTEESEVAPLIRDAVTAFAPLAAVRGVTVETRLARGLVAPVDRGALRQILVNLLDNAIKYGPDGQGVTVSLRVHGAFARIVVDDGGPGIPESEREVVWEPFHRLARDANSSVAGSGIGLAVVRRLALAHRGRVLVDGAPGGGARIVVDLPRVVGRPGEGATPPARGATAPDRA